MRDSKRARIVLAILLVASLTLVILNVRGGGGGVRDAGGSIFGPVERAFSSVARPIGDFFSGLTNVSSNKQKIDELQNKNDELEARLRSLASDQTRADELAALLKVSATGRYKTVPAQVIAVGPTQSFAYTVTIDVGKIDGIKVDQTVISGAGLVGRVVAVAGRTSTVVLIIDDSSTVGARLAGSNEIGFANGRGRDPLELQLLDPQAEITKGIYVATFGSPNGRPYVPGVPIGEVTGVRGTAGSLARVASVKPFVDFTALDIVGVVVEPPRVNPRDAVLPPRPTPTPSITTPPTGTPTTPGSTTPPTSPGATRTP